ncbi:LAME_0E12794g1_1 [Lachancea meyersii CBS 8951]|uniref:LAME_0E12794g1_1 n=1 Tax=Lachancea meyersii CBS 8951 TaxID=1266667 RepID=A0A1G4JM25_9SACH|nr:LAME_0E12794g1_1 [Lachancea meyersii CBS 8951]
MSNPLKVVDISQPTASISGPLLEAARQQGFLFVDGHDFSQEEVDALFALSKRFFTETPEDVKNQYAIKSNNIGYTHFTNEQLDPRKAWDFKEAFNFGNINFKTGTFNQDDAAFNGRARTPEDHENAVPEMFEAHRELISQTSRKLHATAMRILQVMSQGLEVEDPDFFTKKHRPDQASGCVFRMLRYPLIRSDAVDADSYDATIRAGAHTDYGSLTLLFQREGQQGLQLQTGDCEKDAQQGWTEVPFVGSQHKGLAPPLVVNFGDLLSYWTNGVLKSTLHRVKFSPGETRELDRYSIVFFVHPEHATELVPVPSKLVAEHSKGKPATTITAAEHLQERLRATYASEA